MKRMTLIGGIVVGSWRGTWPFGMLTVTDETLTLRFAFLISYSFAPEQITAIERVGSIPFLSTGIRICHNVSNYPENMVFWHFSENIDWLLKELCKRGYGTDYL